MMTPKEISAKASDVREDLIKLSAVTIGMSNYKEVMRRYQEIVNEQLKMIKELADCVDNTLSPQSVNIKVSAGPLQGD